MKATKQFRNAQDAAGTRNGGSVQDDYASNGVSRETRHERAKKEAGKIVAPKASSQEATREARFHDHLKRNQAVNEVGTVKNGSDCADKPEYL